MARFFPTDGQDARGLTTEIKGIDQETFGSDHPVMQKLSAQVMADTAAQPLPSALRELALQLAAALRAREDAAED